ncbi:hypothetical protein [Mycolicibacterium litorale]|nr:hypothetical protein [Mycolicibacterium litorale]
MTEFDLEALSTAHHGYTARDDDDDDRVLPSTPSRRLGLERIFA